MRCINVSVQSNIQLDIKEQEKQEHLRVKFQPHEKSESSD